MRNALSVVPVAALLFATPGVRSQAPEAQEVAKKARAVLANTCHRCHGKDGAIEGGFSYMLDRAQLIARKQVVPNDAAKSRLLRRVERGEMPPEGENPRLSKDDVAVLKRWIELGAPDFNAPVSARAFIPTEDAIKFMHDDLKLRGEADRKFTRYLTLTHLHNAGRSEDELQSYRHGVAKLTNSLSWGRKVVAPVPIDPARTILRIDIRDYKWTGKIWDQVAGADPYGLSYTYNPLGRALCADAGCSLPYVRGDWFVATASRPPLYHEILQLPATEKELESLVRVDVDDNIKTGQVARAGFNGSAVSRNNRLIERHESSYGYYWKSYDFAKNVDRQNLFAVPLGPGAAKELFKHDGGELIFSLPNGMQGYMLVNAEGRRIDKAPTEIVSDPKRPDRAVDNGLSCMSCHVRGILPKDDQIRAHAEKNPKAFTKTELDAILSLYPQKERFQGLIQEDADRYRKAVAQTGIPPGITEPVAALAVLFESELDLPLAAAEAGMKPDDFQKKLSGSTVLARVLGSLQVPGGTVQREAFAKVFPDMATTWRLGTPAPKTAIAASGDKARPNFTPIGGRNPFPAIFQRSDRVLADKDGLRLNGRHYVMTRAGDYLAKDFTFEIVYTLKKGTPNDIAFIGIGEADRNTAYNEPKNSVFLKIHPPNVDDGAVGLANGPAGGAVNMGKIAKEGTHRIAIEKKGDVVTFTIDVDNDGPSDDDLEKTLPDIKDFGAFLNKKNTYIFFGGGGIYQQFRITP